MPEKEYDYGNPGNTLQENLIIPKNGTNDIGRTLELSWGQWPRREGGRESEVSQNCLWDGGCCRQHGQVKH